MRGLVRHCCTKDTRGGGSGGRGREGEGGSKGEGGKKREGE